MVAPAVTGALIKGGLGLLGGLFGRKKAKTPQQNIESQAAGARSAAAKYGFNPLTMLQNGQSGGSMDTGSGIPLASQDLLTGAINDFASIATGENAKENAIRQAELDLLKIQQETARGAVAGIGRTSPVLGGDTIAVDSTTGTYAGGHPMAPGREVKRDPVTDTPGLFSVENSWTGGPITLPGNDGEVLDMGQMINAAIIGGPQIGKNHLKNWLTSDPAFNQEWYPKIERPKRRTTKPKSHPLFSN